MISLYDFTMEKKTWAKKKEKKKNDKQEKIVNSQRIFTDYFQVNLLFFDFKQHNMETTFFTKNSKFNSKKKRRKKLNKTNSRSFFF